MLYPFIYRNALNDLLLKIDESSILFKESLDLQRDKVGFVVKESLIITISMLILGIAVFIGGIWKVYSQEKKNLSGFAKLNTEKVQTVLDRLQEFKDIVESEEFYKADISSQIWDNMRRSPKGHKIKQNAKEHSKTPNHIGIFKKYFGYTFKIIFLMTIVIGLVVANSIMAFQSIKFFEKKQAQVYFTDRLKARAYVAQITSQELLSANDTATVENIKTSDKIPLVIKELIDLRVTASTIYRNDDLSYDPEISTILFTDGCNIKDSTLNAYCNIIKNNGKRTGLIYLLNSLEDLIQSRLLNYQLSTKDSTVLTALESSDLQIVQSTILAISTQCTYIANRINSEFRKELDSAVKQRTLLLALFCVLLSVISLLIWVLVLNRLKDTNNEFKKVLKTLPTHIILSNFRLKSFLIKTSKGALDFVKNDI